MCGIFGIILTDNLVRIKPQVSNILESIFCASQIRGSEASGVAITLGTDTKTSILKIAKRASEVIRMKEWKTLMKTLDRVNAAPQVAILGHTRIATNGRTSCNENNQPITGKFSICIHNGIILNDKDLWKYHSEIYRQLKVDSEIILALYELYKKRNMSSIEAIRQIFSEIEGETNIAIQNKDDDECVLATNTGSLYYMLNTNICIFASEQYILESIVQKHLPREQQTPICHLKANSGLIISLQNGKGTPFLILKQKKRQLSFYKNKNRSERGSLFEYIPAQDFQSIYPCFNNSLRRLQEHEPNYKNIFRLKRCAKCILPETMPMIEFNHEGVCNFCLSYTKQRPLGIKVLKEKIAQYKSSNSEYNCIVPLSGGRDSSYGLYFIKNVLKLKPIAYSYDWGMITETGRRNQARMCAALGVEHVWVSADISKKRENIKKNLEAWLKKPELGMVTLLMAGDKQAEYHVEKLRKQTGIDLVIYCRGNQIEDERFKFGYFGILDGTPKGVIHDLSSFGKMKMLAFYARKFIENTSYVNTSLIDTFSAFTSSYLWKHDFVYLWHYIKWSEDKILKKIIGEYGWEHPSDTAATWRIDDGTPAFYNYIYYTVQGFTENDGLRSNQIREGVISRAKALLLATEENKPRYESLKWYFDTVGVDGDRALSIIDSLATKF